MAQNRYARASTIVELEESYKSDMDTLSEESAYADNDGLGEDEVSAYNFMADDYEERLQELRG